MICLPDTPRWYYDQGKMELGDSVLSRLHDRPLHDEFVQRQKGEILATVGLEHQVAKLQLLTK